MMDDGMPDPTGGARRAPGWIVAGARLFAGIGGAVLMAMMLMTVASVALRTLHGRPISGDFELVELASAITVFCFLPLCQLEGGNVLVDFFTASSSPRLQHALEALGDLLYLALAALLMWRSIEGAAEMRLYDEQTMVLRLPVWWSFVVILPAMAMLVATCAATLVHHLRGALGRAGTAR